MTTERYLDGLVNRLRSIRAGQSGTIRAAAHAVANALRRGGLIHVFGSGHSRLLAEEAFFRAGGLATVNPLLDLRFTFFLGALESTLAERESGLAVSILDEHAISPADVGIVISNSGRNAAPVEMAVEMRRRGLPVIAVSSLSHSTAMPARGTAGTRLMDVADWVLDNEAPLGDASVDLESTESRMGPVSTVTGAAILHSLFLEAAAELVKTGEQPAVLPSANAGASDAALKSELAPCRRRIRLLEGLPRSSRQAAADWSK